MKIKTTQEKYFHQALAIVRAFPPYDKLSPNELQVLGELMKCKHQGYKPLLNSETNKTIPATLGLKAESFRNLLSSLRAKGLIVDNNIPERYLIKYLQPFNFEFVDEN